jgi:erythronate-4-phosphate dehydrogenase
MLLIDDQIPLLNELFSTVDTVRSFDGRSLTRDDLIRYRATGLFVRSTTRCDRALLEGTRVSFVGTATSGTDHIDDEALAAMGINVIDAHGSNANAVAEYVITAILFDGIDCANATVGIVGYGAVGTLVAHYLERLGARIQIYDPLRLAYDGSIQDRHVDFEELLRTSDIITFHPNLHAGEVHPSLHMLHAATAALIRDEALVINTSRGEVFTADAVEHLLKRADGRLVLDVWPNEPVPDPSIVEQCLIATPHIAGYTINAKEQGAMDVAVAYIQKHGLAMTLLDRVVRHADADVTIDWDADALAELLLDRRPIDLDAEAFVKAYLAAPTAATFDAARKNYPLRAETLHG